MPIDNFCWRKSGQICEMIPVVARGRTFAEQNSLLLCASSLKGNSRDESSFPTVSEVYHVDIFSPRRIKGPQVDTGPSVEQEVRQNPSAIAVL